MKAENFRCTLQNHIFLCPCDKYLWLLGSTFAFIPETFMVKGRLYLINIIIVSLLLKALFISEVTGFLNVYVRASYDSSMMPRTHLKYEVQS